MCESKPLAVTYERCHELLEICEPSDPAEESGLKNKVNRGPRARAGDWAGNLRPEVMSSGEIYKVWRVKIDGKHYYAARIIYFMTHGVDPYPLEVDHKNKDSRDNSVENLRLGDRELQTQHRGLHINNKSGIAGVTWNKRAKKWLVRVKDVYLGYFTTLKEAAAARNEGVKKHFLEETWEAALVDLETITD
jgi:hypothetical protein